MKTSSPYLILAVCLFLSAAYAQNFNPDTVKAGKYDMGKMWTFENPPLDYFEEEYGFRPGEEWLEFVRKSALRFGNGCSASFVSEDGLIMTNHHCARSLIPAVEKDDEDFLRDGFFAKNIKEERRISGLFVNQLMIIEDVTEEIKSAIEKEISDSAKVSVRKEKINEIRKRFEGKDSSLNYRVVPLYNGGKYSVYGYKRYNDIRLVFAPDLRTAKFGGDYDNFTYPRYGLDCTFLRAYENGKPIKTKYFFKWNVKGAQEGEAVFVVGNPGSTDRLNTIAQMEYARDIQYPVAVKIYRGLYALQEKKVIENNAQDFSLIARLYSIGNTLKVYEGTLAGLNDEYLMARKKVFEENFKNVVQGNPILKGKYGDVWDKIAQSRKDASSIAKEIYAYSINPVYSSTYFAIASGLVDFAKDLIERGRIPFSKSQMDSIILSFYPDNMDVDYERELVKIHVDIMIDNLGMEHELVKKLFDGRTGYAAADFMISNSYLKSPDEYKKFTEMTPEEILNSGDPFIYFKVYTRDKLSTLQLRNEGLKNRESVYKQLLGEALFEVYGDDIPPDATGTLRIADGVLKSYSYNGTIAPVYTTFYGVLDRHYGFNKKFPYNLSPIWDNLPEDFDLKSKLNFISTNDIIGGNSGSPVINKNAEIVGLAFDGNIESLPARYIFTTEANRTLSVHPEGMIEAIRDLYNASRISNELLGGKIE